MGREAGLREEGSGGQGEGSGGKGEGSGECLPPPPSTPSSKAVVPVSVLLFAALWFILRGDLSYVLPFVILFLCFSVLLALRLPRLGKRKLILVLFVRLFDLRLFGFVGFLLLWTFLLPFFFGHHDHNYYQVLVLEF